MPSNLPQNIIKLVIALLKHQAELWMGEEALGIAGSTLVEISGQELNNKIAHFLATNEGKQKILSAVQRADNHFQENCQNITIKGALSLSFGNLPSVLDTLADLPDAMDLHNVRDALQKAITRDIPSLTQTEVKSAIDLYIESLERALLPLKEFTLPLIGQIVLSNQEKLGELGANHDDIISTLRRIETTLNSSNAKTVNLVNLDSPSPEQITEILYSNLLPVSFPENIYTAKTQHRRRNGIYKIFYKNRVDPIHEFILVGDKIYSFHNLQESTWNGICFKNSVKLIPSNQLAHSDNLATTNHFIDLLSRSLRAKLEPDVVLDETEGYYYFAPTHDLSVKKISYQSTKRTTSRVVFRAYYKKNIPSETAYYRHSAFYGQFFCFDSTWYLQISPHYRFTTNGYKVSLYKQEQLKKIKRLELNPAVLGQVVMWAEYLKDSPDLFHQRYPYLTIGDLETFELNVGIDDKKWLSQEDSDSEFKEVIKSRINDLGVFHLLKRGSFGIV